MSRESAAPSEVRYHHRFFVNAHWLLRLRWVAVAGQLATIAFVVAFLHVALSLAPIIAIVAVTAISNVALFFWLKKVGDGDGPYDNERGHKLLAAIMGLDLLALTGLLYFSGGAENPFLIFYFVNLTLSAIILPSRWGWTLTILAVACMSLLFFFYEPLPELDPQLHSATNWPLREKGLLVALAACPCVVIYFITRVTRELQEREMELRVAEQKRSRSERLEALGTLAAGAGHELATPLSTIAVVAKELSRQLEFVEVPATVREDFELIRKEVDSCRLILNRMRGGVGQAAGEPVTVLSAAKLVEEVIAGLHTPNRVAWKIPNEAGRGQLKLPIQSVAQAIRGVIQNAVDASAPESAVNVQLQLSDRLCIVVSDTGAGMPPDILQRAGEPFFTTKEPGRGMGLGLFLTRSVIERVAGEFQLESQVGRGTVVTIRLPILEN